MKQTVTIRTLARELGLSVSAVSKALNDYPDIGAETKAMVLARAKALGYTPNLLARHLAKQSSSFVGVVIRDVASVYGEMFKSLNAEARRRGLTLILYDTGNDPAVEKRCVQNLIDSRAMGILLTPVSEDVSPITAMTGERLPLVCLGGKTTSPDVSCVCSDSRAGTAMALSHLIGLGHRRIAMVCDRRQSASRSAKAEAYRQAMRDIGQPEHILFCDGQDYLAAGYALGQRLAAGHEGVTAVFAVKDSLAIGLAGGLADTGVKVPGGVSVVGYDGLDETALPQIRLTTVAQPREVMAQAALDMLCRHAAQPSLPPERVQAVPELVLRASTGPAPHHDVKQESPV